MMLCSTNIKYSLPRITRRALITRQHRITVSSNNDGMKCLTRNGEWTIVSDYHPIHEIKHYPTPRELLLSALGSCTIMTIKTYSESQARNYKIRDINVILEEIMEVSQHVPKNIEVNIIMKYTGTIDNDTLSQKIKSIADKCPVKRIITGSNSEFISTKIQLEKILI